MATPGVINATDLNLYINVATVPTKIGNATSAGMTLTHSPRETTNNDSLGWETYAPGKLGGEFNGDALYAFDATYGFSQLFAAYTNRTLLTITFKTATNGDKYYAGTGYLTSLSSTGSTEDNESYSFTFKINGVIAEAVVGA